MATGRPRPLASADLDRVAEIERDTFPDPWSKRSFAETIEREQVRSVAIDDEEGRLVGYAMSVRAGDEGEILNIAVDERARGHGSGRALLDDLLEDLRNNGVRQVFLEVRRSNEAAIGLYRSAGFHPLGVRPGYYGRPREDALTMVLELASQTARKG
ncbi:MAG: ribosomal protein S18-alanine N-acetyltransferase [Gemmatimonadales bacterium]